MIINELPDFEFDVNGNPIIFDGISTLKKPDVKLPWTKEHIEEWLKCKEDVFYFAEKYHYILDIDKGLHKIVLRDYQKEMIQSFIEHRYNIVLASRQVGKSTSFEIFVLHYLLFNKDKSIAILANKESNALDILRKIKQAYELLPKWMQQGVKSWNAKSIRLENGCYAFASSTSSSAIRGRSISLLIIDEMAFIPRNIWEDFFASSYPTISSGLESKVIFVSTPNGLNHFYKFWSDAEEARNKFKQTRVDWWQDPKKMSQPNWKEDTIANIGLVRFNQEFGNEFLGSSYTLIDSQFIKQLKHKQPIDEIELHHRISRSYHKFMKVYEDVKPGHTYSLGVDSAKMTETQNGDNITIQVLDITSIPYKQVCTLNIKEGISYLQLPQLINDIGNYYNQAFVFIENNEIGQEVANNLNFDYEYENVFFEKGALAGFRTTKKTKKLGCNNLKILTENDKIQINDFDTIAEISTFIKNKDSYKAEPGYTDDLILSLIAALFFMQRKEFETFEDSKDMLTRIFEKSVENVDEDLPSFGFSSEYDEEESIF